MEEKAKKGCDKTREKKTISKTCYNNRKECIKRKTMELATLCGVDACTIIYGPDGTVDSWPENPTQVKAVISNLKNLMSDPNNKKTAKDESIRTVAEPKGKEIESFLVNSTAEKTNMIKTIDFFEENNPRTVMRDESQKKVRNSSLTDTRDSERLMKFIEKGSVHLGKSWSEKYQEEFLKQLNSTLTSVTNRIGLLTKNKQSDTTDSSSSSSSSLKRKQVDCISEENGQKRMRINQAPVFDFDLNCLPPDEVFDFDLNCLPPDEVAPPLENEPPPEITPSTSDDQLNRAVI